MLTKLQFALDKFKDGNFVIVTDDAHRENEGDLFLLANRAATEKLGFMIRHTSGVICTALTEERSRQLHLPLMVKRNQDPKQTAFTVSVDVKHGITTGISAEERANTIKALADANSCAEDFIRPGHIFPLVAVEGGLRVRRGHTEAAIEMCLRTGETPVVVISEMINEDGSIMRGSRLLDFANKFDIPIISIEELSQNLSPIKSQNVKKLDWAKLPRKHANWRIATHQGQDGVFHSVMALGDIQGETLVRIHSECLTGDVFGSMRCDCGDQLSIALHAIEVAGSGLIIYLRNHEGRGIGLSDKINAYKLQDQGFDTVDANHMLGHDVDERNYKDATEILINMGISKVLLLTNNPDKEKALRSAGIEVKTREIKAEPNQHNINYLLTKSKRMGHLI
jgi:3,4-dihydroxy 2-butanone 4-phosphate synthase/GTP cyclohydrolase II